MDYFHERREKVYEKRAHIPSTMGLTSDIWGNVGEVKSWGWDGSADLNYAINKDAWLTGRFNFTYAKMRLQKEKSLLIGMNIGERLVGRLDNSGD